MASCQSFYRWRQDVYGFFQNHLILVYGPQGCTNLRRIQTLATPNFTAEQIQWSQLQKGNSDRSQTQTCTPTCPMHKRPQHNALQFESSMTHGWLRLRPAHPSAFAHASLLAPKCVQLVLHPSQSGPKSNNPQASMRARL